MGGLLSGRSPGRRTFLRRLGASVAASVAVPGAAARGAEPTAPPSPAPVKPVRPLQGAPAESRVSLAQEGWPQLDLGTPVDLSPARWIWLPSERTLASTVALFRREIELVGEPSSARGWVSADSRYRLWVNGRRVQWGPAPCDPRRLEVDPVDVTSLLVPGKNVIAAEVVFYGHGEGTWPAGKPGFLFALQIQQADGGVQQIVSDERWQVMLDRAHPPGQHKRAYLRAFQEEFDARQRPAGWNETGFTPGDEWLGPLVLGGGADFTAAASPYPEYLTNGGVDPADSALVTREVPLVRETARPVLRLLQSGRIRWKRNPDDWFEFRIPGSFELVDGSVAFPSGDGAWTLDPPREEGVWALFELPEQMVGFPFFTVEAPEGTILEVMTQESHSEDNPPWLDTHLFSWSRFVCREGESRFELLDYESLRYLQIHVRHATAPVMIRDVGVRRRSYDWPRPPHFNCNEPGLQRLFEASFNTLTNAAQETIVDGMGRERQQYSGDVSHMLHATRLVCGDWDLSRRFQHTFALGQTHEGYFFDCWPAWDRLNRIGQRETGSTQWGPLLDHGVSFIHDVYRHHQETSEIDLAQELYPQLARFARYLLNNLDKNKLLPVEGWGVPTVWMDGPDCYQRQRHRQLAFNLFTAGVLKQALVPLADLAGETRDARRFTNAADALVRASVQHFWSRKRGIFVANLPWLTEEGGGVRLDDRSLASSLLFRQCPQGNTEAAVAELAEPSIELGLSFPANAHWRLQALAYHGRIDVVLRELRYNWAALPSVVENNTIAEHWEHRPDSTDQWSHAAVSPLFLLYMDIAGIRPAAPGFLKVNVRPQLGDLPATELTLHTGLGPIAFQSQLEEDGHTVHLTLPADCEAELRLPSDVPTELRRLGVIRSLGLSRYTLPTGETVVFKVPRT